MSTPDPADGPRREPPRPEDEVIPPGLEGYPYASPSAERTIKLTTTVMSVLAVGLLLAGLYFALFTEQVAIGALMTLIGFVDLIIVPFFAKTMRRQALQREGKGP